MPQYNVFQAIFMSFYSKGLYRDVAQNWGGRAFLYLLVLLVITWIPYIATYQIMASQIYPQFVDKLVPQVPVITVKNGKISTPEKRPYFIVMPNSKRNIVTIDTTGQYKTPTQANSSVLITETQIISQNNNETRIKDVPNTTNIVIDPSAIKNHTDYYLKFFWVLLFLVMVPLSYIGRLIQVLVYSIIGIIISSMGSVGLSYGQVMKIMMVAITPVIILTLILDFSPISLSHPGIVSFIVAMAYMCFGIFANKKA